MAYPHIAGDASLLSEAQRELIDRAAALGRERFAPRAAQIDADAVFPSENFADLHEAGLLSLCVPQAAGGQGADFATFMLVAAELGRHCGATALTWSMHCAPLMWAGFLADALDMAPGERADHARCRAVHFARVVEGGKVYSQLFSEVGAAAAGKAPFGTLATPVDGGYRVSGRKIFASLSGAADYYGLLCTLDKPGAGLRDALLLAVPADAPGVAVDGDWDALGMRGTVSRSLTFTDVFVADEARLLPPGMFFEAAARFPQIYTVAAPTYLGLAQAAFDFSVQFLRGAADGAQGVKRRMYPTKQMAVAEMRVKLEQARALFLAAARSAPLDPNGDARMRLYAAHHTVMEHANDIARLAIRTCGGQTVLKSLPLERLYRDSRCGSLMLPWTAELCLDHLGRECLYEPGERDEAIDA